jgi:hypothetical protein
VTDHPFKCVAVELLIPSTKSSDDVLSALREIRDDEPICEYRLLCREVGISGPAAEDRFGQPDLVYPGKVTPAVRVKRILDAGIPVLDAMAADPTTVDTEFLLRFARLSTSREEPNSVAWLEAYLKLETPAPATPIVSPGEVRLMSLTGNLAVVEEITRIVRDHPRDFLPETIESERAGWKKCEERRQENVALQAENAKLLEFKRYVHATLTDMGIPENPAGEHADAGCRVGQRLHIVKHMLGMTARLPALSVAELQRRWRAAGGSFYGPNLENGTMPEGTLMGFLNELRRTP